MGLEQIYGMEKMNILQCQEMAKDIGFDKAEFELHGPKGKLDCKWVDAYFGFFEIKGQDGVMMVDRNLRYAPDIHCENLRLPGDA